MNLLIALLLAGSSYANQDFTPDQFVCFEHFYDAGKSERTCVGPYINTSDAKSHVASRLKDFGVGNALDPVWAQIKKASEAAHQIKSEIKKDSVNLAVLVQIDSRKSSQPITKVSFSVFATKSIKLYPPSNVYEVSGGSGPEITDFVAAFKHALINPEF